MIKVVPKYKTMTFKCLTENTFVDINAHRCYFINNENNAYINDLEQIIIAMNCTKYYLLVV